VVGVAVVGAPPAQKATGRRFFHDTAAVAVIAPIDRVTLVVVFVH